MHIDIDGTQIDNMLEQMNLVKIYYYDNVRRNMRRAAKNNQRKKGDNQSQSPKKLSASIDGSKKSPSKLEDSRMACTFVNIKHARYQIGPALQYNTKNIQFPQIGRPKNSPTKSSKPHAHNPPKNMDQSSSNSLLNSSIRYIQKSHVKQSWDKYININSLSKSDYMTRERDESQGKGKGKGKTLTKGYRTRRAKDLTEENIEGWKSWYQEDQIGGVGAHKG